MIVIPAHPLALTAERKLDERRQRALTRYYLAAGAGGVAVGVHTTQFAIRDAGLLRPVLTLAAEELKGRPVMKIAGVVGRTAQALGEAALARELGYDAGLLSLGALKESSIEELLAHSREVAAVIPVMGFYLQPSVGGRILPYNFWRQFVEIDGVMGIKVAPFNRYQTLDVIRAVRDSGRPIPLYTGNDDHIIMDLVSGDFKGGLLGHWSVWTRRAVEQVELARRGPSPALRKLADEITDSNAAFFDPPNGFRGCIAGLHEVLRRQGLLAGRWCLDPNEDVSPGQMEEIDRVYGAYPHLNDDEFVRSGLDEWLK